MPCDKDLEDGSYRYIRIKYEEPPGELKVYMVDELLTPLSSNQVAILRLDLAEIFDIGPEGELWYGFTGTTGRKTNTQTVCLPLSKYINNYNDVRVGLYAISKYNAYNYNLS